MKIYNQSQIQKYNYNNHYSTLSFRAGISVPVQKVAVTAATALASAGVAAVAMNKGKLSHLCDEQKTEIRQMRVYNRNFKLGLENDIDKTLETRTTDLRELETKFFSEYSKLWMEASQEDDLSGDENSPSKHLDSLFEDIIKIINDKDRKISPKHILPFLNIVGINNKDFVLKIFSDPERAENYKDYVDLMRYVNPATEQVADWLLNDKSLNLTPNEIADYCFSISQTPLRKCSLEEIKGYLNDVMEQKKIVNKHPDLYLNEGYTEDFIEKFFNAPNRVVQMMSVMNTFKDKSFLNDLLRLRLYDACEYMELLDRYNRGYVKAGEDKFDVYLDNDNAVDGLLNSEDNNEEPKVGSKLHIYDTEESLAKLLKSNNPDGSPLSFKQKLFILKHFDVLFSLYEEAGIEDLLKEGVLNEERLKKKIVYTISNKVLNLHDENDIKHGKKMLLKLDTEKLMILYHKVAEAAIVYQKSKEENEQLYKSLKLFFEVLYSLYYDAFEESLFAENYSACKANAKTLEIFEKNNLDVEKWVGYRKYVKFQYKDENVEALKQISAQLLEDIDKIRKSPAGGIFDKKMKDYVQDGKFVIPQETLDNPNLLKEFIKKMLNITQPIKNQAEKNNNKNALTLFNHIEQRVKDLNSVKHIKGKKDFDLKIKMWDRNPIHDLFQGNYSDCCIALDEFNSDAMVEYLTHIAFNMIEIIDNQTGETIGNALCYFAKNKGKPIFIIDNIEIKPSMKPSEEGQRTLRKAIADFAKHVAVNVSSNRDIEVYLGANFNDVTTDDLKSVVKDVQFIGEVTSDEVYMDVFDGWREQDKLKGKRKLIYLC